MGVFSAIYVSAFHCVEWFWFDSVRGDQQKLVPVYGCLFFVTEKGFLEDLLTRRRWNARIRPSLAAPPFIANVLERAGNSAPPRSNVCVQLDPRYERSKQARRPYQVIRVIPFPSANWRPAPHQREIQAVMHLQGRLPQWLDMIPAYFCFP